ncbi:hypothetical protein CsatA_017480 [Cannabis sativa]
MIMVRCSQKRRKTSDEEKVKENEEEESYSANALMGFMSNIVPEELLIQILMRVSDLRSLIQCTSVCKTWYSLITRNQFISDFVQFLNHRPRYHHIMPYTILFRDIVPNSNTKFYELFSEESKIIHKDIVKLRYDYESFYPWGSQFFIRATFLDMLLISPKLQSNQNHEFCISNPLTKKWIELPTSVPPLSRKLINMIMISKVVLFEQDFNNSNARVMIFCSDIGEWSSSMLPYSLLWPNLVEYPLLEDSIASNNGIIYWLLKVGVNEVKGIVSCNPFTEEADPKRHRFIEFPKIYFPHFISLYISCKATHGMKKVYKDKIRIGIVRGRLRLSFVKSEDELLWCLVHKVKLRKTTKMDKTFVLGFHPTNPDVIFLSRNYNLYKYQVGEDKYKLHDRFPKVYHDEKIMKKNPHHNLSVFVLVHPPSSIANPPHLSPWSIIQ